MTITRCYYNRKSWSQNTNVCLRICFIVLLEGKSLATLKKKEKKKVKDSKKKEVFFCVFFTSK